MLAARRAVQRLRAVPHRALSTAATPTGSSDAAATAAAAAATAAAAPSSGRGARRRVPEQTKVERQHDRFVLKDLQKYADDPAIAGLEAKIRHARPAMRREAMRYLRHLTPRKLTPAERAAARAKEQAARQPEQTELELALHEMEKALGIPTTEGPAKQAARLALNPALDPLVAQRMWDESEAADAQKALRAQQARAAAAARAAADGKHARANNASAVAGSRGGVPGAGAAAAERLPRDLAAAVSADPASLTPEQMGAVRAAAMRARMREGKPAIEATGVVDPDHLRPRETGGALDAEMRKHIAADLKAATDRRRAGAGGGGVAAAAMSAEDEGDYMWKDSPADRAWRESGPAEAAAAAAERTLQAARRAAAKQQGMTLEEYDAAERELMESDPSNERAQKIAAAKRALERAHMEESNRRQYTLSSLEMQLEAAHAKHERTDAEERQRRMKEKWRAELIAAEDLRPDGSEKDPLQGSGGSSVEHLTDEQAAEYAETLAARVYGATKEPRAKVKKPDEPDPDVRPAPTDAASLKEQLQQYRGDGRIAKLKRDFAKGQHRQKESLETIERHMDYDLETEAYIKANEKRLLEPDVGEVPISDADRAAFESFYTKEMTRAYDKSLEPPPYDPHLGSNVKPFFRPHGRGRTPYHEREWQRKDELTEDMWWEDMQRRELGKEKMLRFDEYRRACADPHLKAMLDMALSDPKTTPEVLAQAFTIVRDQLDLIVNDSPTAENLRKDIKSVADIKSYQDKRVLGVAAFNAQLAQAAAKDVAAAKEAVAARSRRARPSSGAGGATRGAGAADADPQLRAPAARSVAAAMGAATASEVAASSAAKNVRRPEAATPATSSFADRNRRMSSQRAAIAQAALMDAAAATPSDASTNKP